MYTAIALTRPLPTETTGEFHVIEGAERLCPDPYATFPGPLPPEEMAKLERLERLGRHRPFSLSSWWESVKPRKARPHGGSEDRLGPELGANAAQMLRRVPLCLLDTKVRQGVSDLRAYGWGSSPNPHPHLDARGAFASIEAQLRTAMNLTDGQAAALAGLARWETEPGEAAQLSARARGADAVRSAVMDRMNQRATGAEGGPLHIHVGAPHDPGLRDVALPPPHLLHALGLAAGAGAGTSLNLGDARPLDASAFRASAACLKLAHLGMEAVPNDKFPFAWMPDSVSTVELYSMDSKNAASLEMRHAKQLAQHAPPALERIKWLHGPSSDASAGARPAGWSHETSGLRRMAAVRPDAAFDYFLPVGRQLADRAWDRCRDRPAALPLAAFLASLHRRVEALKGGLNAAAMREEACARVGRVMRTLADEPALLDACHGELVVDAPCVDAQMKLLRDLDLAIGTRVDITSDAPSGALLRMALMNAADRHVALQNASAENIEQGLALQALIDFKLANLTGKPMTRTARPHYRAAAGMRDARRHFGLRRTEAAPAAKDWPAGMHHMADQIIGEEVRAGFPGLRDLLSSPEGPIRRLVDRLLADQAYQKLKADREAEFEAAEERIQNDDAGPEDHQRYERAQLAVLPAALAEHQLALMDDWLAPLRRAYPVARPA